MQDTLARLFGTLHWFYPGEALLVALILTVVPYVTLRGLANRLTLRKGRSRSQSSPARTHLIAAALACMSMGVIRAQLSSRAQPGQPPPVSEGENADDLRKAAQNPVASLISVPIQENWDFNIGPADCVQNVMNIQPVIPITLGRDWNLIIRWITPVIYQPVAVQEPSGSAVQSGDYGLGDMQPAFFISPKKRALVGARLVTLSAII